MRDQVALEKTKAVGGWHWWTYDVPNEIQLEEYSTGGGTGGVSYTMS